MRVVVAGSGADGGADAGVAGVNNGNCNDGAGGDGDAHEQRRAVAGQRLEVVAHAARTLLARRAGQPLDVVADQVGGVGEPVLLAAHMRRHAAEAMEMGADAVLVNTALAIADDPVQMATAFRLGTQAGRMAYLAGPGAASREARASSPLTGFLR